MKIEFSPKLFGHNVGRIEITIIFIMALLFGGFGYLKTVWLLSDIISGVIPYILGVNTKYIIPIIPPVAYILWLVWFCTGKWIKNESRI